jgi:hypothetical protein
MTKKKVPCDEDRCGLRLPALPCGYCNAPRTRTPRTSPEVARRAGKKSSTTQTSALDARQDMEMRSMPPHTPCTWAMTCFSTWTGPSTRRTLCRPPSVNATGPKMAARSSHHHWSQIGLAADTETTQASGIQQRKEERQIDGQQCNLIWQCCTALRWAALANSYPLATLRTSSTRRLGTQENRDSEAEVVCCLALRPSREQSVCLAA